MLDNRSISFDQNERKWIITLSPVVIDQKSIPLTLFTTLLPIILVLWAGIKNRRANDKLWKLVIFFASSLAGVYTAYRLSVYLNQQESSSILGSVLFFAMLAFCTIPGGTILNWKDNSSIQWGIGSIALGVTLSASPFIYGNSDISGYLIYMVVMEIVCFTIAHFGVRYWKNRKLKLAQMET
jgi:hypothetical protein